MSKFKIYGENYDLETDIGGVIDSYAYKGELVDEEPKGKFVGYVTMEDGSIISCYKSINMLLFVPIILAALAGIGALIYFVIMPMFEKDVAIGGTMLQTDVGKNVVTFNGIMAANNGELDVRFVNGGEPATIKVEGDGVVTDEYSVEPNSYVEKIPVRVTSAESVVEVKVTINSSGTANTFNALVEIPANGNQYDPNPGLNSYFEKELILDERTE